MWSKLLAVALVGVLAAGGAFVNALWGPRARARKRLATGNRRIADGELVTVIGKVRALGRLEAPLSGRPCVAFEAVAQLKSQGVVTDRLVDNAMTPFELVTADGVILVDGIRVDFGLAATPIIPRRIEREQRFLSARDFHPAAARTTSFDEIAVADGDTISVHGMAVVEAAPAAAERGYRDSALRVRIVAHPKHPLTIAGA